MKPLHIAGWAAIIIGSADLVLGQSGTPLPILGDYLTQQTDFILIFAGVLAVFVIK